jgi:CRP-like cAMP-binding protein
LTIALFRAYYLLVSELGDTGAGFSDKGGNPLMTPDTLTAMRQCPFFEELQPKHMEKLMTLGTQVHFEKDEIIFHEEDESHLFYVILSGRVVLEARHGASTFQLETLYPRQEVGWAAVVNRKRQLQARALEPVTAMAFEVSQLRDACRTNPYLGCAFLERLLTLAVEQLQSTRLRFVQTLGQTK